MIHCGNLLLINLKILYLELYIVAISMNNQDQYYNNNIIVLIGDSKSYY